MKQYVIGIDIGTTCTKVLVVDELGKVVGQGSKGYPLHSRGLQIEQQAQDWIDAAAYAIAEAVAAIDPNCVVGISCSTQGGSTVPVRADGSFVGNAWTWMDRRSHEQTQFLTQQLGDSYVYRVTGSAISPALDAAKIMNMKSDPAYNEAVAYYTTLEVVNRWLTGNPVIDPSNAAMRQLMNIDTAQWDETILSAVGVSEKELPQIMAAGAPVGRLTASAAAATGLPEGICVYNGAHDQYCASLGAGATQAGDMLLSAGTTWVLMGITDKPLYTDSRICPGRHPIQGLYGALASLVGSGASMQWFNENFMSADFNEMNRIVPERTEKTKDLFFFPYLNGAPYPVHNKNARGVFAGLTLEHDQFDLARALMEGVCFGVRRAVTDFQTNGTQINSILMMGGASKSAVWMQMIASITGIPIKQLAVSDACAMGAAMIAGCGAGLFPDYRAAADAMVRCSRIFEPVPEEQAYYKEKFEKFDRLWACLNSYYKGESI